MSDLTKVELKEYIERIFDEREKTVHLVASNLEHRLETLNALRADVLRDRDMFLMKATYNEMHSALTDRVDKLESTQAKIIGVGMVLVVIAGLVGAVLAHLLKL